MHKLFIVGFTDDGVTYYKGLYSANLCLISKFFEDQVDKLGFLFVSFFFLIAPAVIIFDVDIDIIVIVAIDVYINVDFVIFFCDWRIKIV